MGDFVRDRVPDTATFLEGEGLALTGRGLWRTTRCEFHGGSDSMRVNTESGGWVCMACDAKGGDAIAYLVQRDGLDFITAARRLGCWDESRPYSNDKHQAKVLAPRDALEVIAIDLGAITMVMADARSGVLPSNADWDRFLTGVGRIQALAAEYGT